MSEPIPIILCGGSPVIAAGVKANLLPEYETIHVILSSAAGIAEIPILLEGGTPPAGETDNVGTKNYSKKALAIVTGAGYEDEQITQMREACKGKASVPWLRPDTKIPAPPLGPEYGKALVARVKATMKQLIDSGKMGEDEIVWY